MPRLFAVFCFVLLAAAPVQARSFHSFGDRITETALFAGGCLECLHDRFQTLAGIDQITPGVTADHIAVIRVIYDRRRVSFGQILRSFWDSVQTTAPPRNFCMAGRSYQAGVFITTSPQRELAERLLARQATPAAQAVSFVRSSPIFYFAPYRQARAQAQADCR